MKRFEVNFRPLAEADLFDLYSYITREAGRRAAEAYIDRVEAACESLETFPERGTRRDDISPVCGRWASSGAQRSPTG